MTRENNSESTGATKRVHLVSLGCPKARVDSELMAGLLKDGNAELTDSAEGADTIIVNTCAFLESATQESIDTVLELAELKKHGNCQKLVVTGCLVQRYGAELSDALPEVDTFLGTNELTRIAEAVTTGLPERTYMSEGSHLYRAGDPRLPITLGGSTYLKIAEGCNRTCSFCIIPDIRGKQVSRGVPDLLRETEQLVALGIKEVVLIAQDLTSYGTDLGMRRGLEQLLRGMDEIDGLPWIRLQYCYPWNFTDDLVDLIRKSDRVVPYVDMPLQHISDRILKSMRRSVKRDEQRRLLEKLRSIDGMVLRTTLITGYPGESDAEFQELYDWVEEIGFDHMGVFSYSQEEGTLAAGMADQIPDAVKDERRDALMVLQQGIAATRNRSLIGRELDVLVDGQSDEHEYVMEGRYYGQAPEIDGCVYLSFPEEAQFVAPGQFVKVRIDDATAYDLAGEVLGRES